MSEQSKDIQDVARQPNVNLLESREKQWFEPSEEFAMLGKIRDVDLNTDQVIAIDTAFVLPLPAGGLRFTGHRTEVLTQLQQSFRNQIVGN